MAKLSDLDLSEITLVEQSIAKLKVSAIKIQTSLNNIQTVMEKRASGELAEPKINFDALDPVTNPDPDVLKSLADFGKFVTNNIVVPSRENSAMFESLSKETQLLLAEEDAPIFDLTYGPPISVKGQFIMAEDGLYYDSISGGVPVISGTVDASSSWGLNYPPNIGGKGIPYTQADLDNLTDTIFDYNYDPSTQEGIPFYDSDDILESFTKNKAKHIDLVLEHIVQLTASGYDPSSAVVTNYYNNIGALSEMYDVKIKRRKKLLQLVSIYGILKYGFTDELTDSPKNLSLGPGILIENLGTTKDPEWVPIERIPLNDFSFLKSSGLDISLRKQEKLLIFSEDLEDVIAPVHVRFIKSKALSLPNIGQFSVPPTPRDSFPYFQGDPHVSGTGGIVQSLTTSIHTEGMILGYNFLEAQSIVDASSNLFKVDNIVNDTSDNFNGQLVGSSIDAVFVSGLGIPKLTGTHANGSYVRLPANYTPDGINRSLRNTAIDDLFYPPNARYDHNSLIGGGVTFDFWVHIPSLTFTDQHRYRLIAACENSGKSTPTSQTQEAIYASRTNLSNSLSENKVHGMIMGFRDKGGNSSPSGIEFGVFPTVSQNRTDQGSGHNICIAEALTYEVDGSLLPSGIIELGAKTNSEVSSQGSYITKVEEEFTHISVVFDFKEDLITTYFDGVALTSKSIRKTFDTGNTRHIGIPSTTFAPDINNLGVSSFNNEDSLGPKIGNLGLGFTPWILGGGFSDRTGKDFGAQSIVVDTPGFLGFNTNTFYGDPTFSQQSYPIEQVYTPTPSSGLDGFLGSFKLYSKALSNTEVATNFNSQKGFFKNIKIS